MKGKQRDFLATAKGTGLFGKTFKVKRTENLPVNSGIDQITEYKKSYQ